MLAELRVKNFAIVEDGELEFEEGFTAFTGETGAGKSLLLDAITLLLGAKARSDLVRTGAKSAEVEGVFVLGDGHKKLGKLLEAGFQVEAEDGYRLIVRREISGSENHRNRVWIQGKSATRTQLQEFFGDWVEVSGQHEFLQLGQESYLLKALDSFAGLGPKVKEYRELLQTYKILNAELEKLRELENSRVSRLEFIEFQLSEFKKVGLSEGLVKEESRLEALRSRLMSLEKLRHACQVSRQVLDGSSEEKLQGLLQGFRDLVKEFRPLEKSGEEIVEFLRLTENAQNATQEVSDQLERVERLLDFDSSELDEVESRISELNRLKRKHHCDSSELLNLMQVLEEEKERLDNSDARREILDAQFEKCKQVLGRCAHSITEQRKDACERLQKVWQKGVRQLGLEKAVIEMSVEVGTEFGSYGSDNLKVLFCANPGDIARPIGKVASGGELSRIMLSLKNLSQNSAEVGVFLFDEIDTGIGGHSALQVADKLRSLSDSNQVLVVTHLASIASAAHNQFQIRKNSDKNRTQTVIAKLSNAERETEIARMLGDQSSKSALGLSRELLKKFKSGSRPRSEI